MIQLTLTGSENPHQISLIYAILGALYAPAQAEAALDADVFGSRTLHLPPVAEGESAALLAKLEAENPQFGKQPLPTGAVASHGDAAEAQARADVLAAHTSGPLAPPSPPSAPSPAAAAPSTSAPAAPPGSSADVDKNGFPWDERIHASSRAKIADGTWRMKRGVPQHVVDEVEAQLRAQAPVAASEPAAPPAPPGPPAPPAAPIAGAGLTFGQLAKRVGAKITLGELTAQDLGTQMAALGFPGGLHEANARPDMWATILETLGA